MLRGLEANIQKLDINTDSMLAVQYYEENNTRNAQHVAILFQKIEEIAATHQIQFKLKHMQATNCIPISLKTDVVLCGKYTTKKWGANYKISLRPLCNFALHKVQSPFQISITSHNCKLVVV